jgi:tetratricopeptide (TPR) repeat protein
VESRSPEGYAGDLEAGEEIALLEAIGEEAFRERQRRRLALRRLMWDDMHRSARAETEALIAEGEKDLFGVLAEILQSMDEIEGARDAYLAAFRESKEPQGWYAMSLAATYEEGERDGVFKDLLKEFRGRRDHEAVIWLARGHDQKSRGLNDDARRSLRKARALGAGVGARVGAAELALAAGELDAAAAELDPDAEDGVAMEHVLLGWIAEERGDEGAAAEHFEAARDMEEDIGRQVFWRGQAAARSVSEDGGDGDGEDEEEASSAPTDDPRRWYRLAGRLAPEDDSDTLNSIGYQLAEEGVEIDLAVDLLRRAAALSEEEDDSGLYNVLDSLAWALHRRGDHEEALELMKRALRAGGARARGNETMCYHLGAIYGAVGLTGLACEELEKIALDQAPAEDDESEAAEARRLLDRYRPEVAESAAPARTGM